MWGVCVYFVPMLQDHGAPSCCTVKEFSYAPVLLPGEALNVAAISYSSSNAPFGRNTSIAPWERTADCIASALDDKRTCTRAMTVNR